jgi:hypothetical protein
MSDRQQPALKEPIIIVAFSRTELAARRAEELPGLVAVVLNRLRAHGDPEEVCKAYEPSLTAALGAWWDEHFTCTEAQQENPITTKS